MVHLHLEHRVVQRLLGRFTAQGFVHHDLSRACLTHTSERDSAGDSARAAEPLWSRRSAIARRADPGHRALDRSADSPETALSPYAREAEARTLTLLEESPLVASHGHPIADTVIQQLQRSASKDVQELLPHLQARGEAYARDAEQKLQGNGATPKQRPCGTSSKRSSGILPPPSPGTTKWMPAQLSLDFGDNEDERRQLEANKRYWSQRLPSLEEELQNGT